MKEIYMDQQQPFQDLDGDREQEIGELQRPEDPKATDDIEKRKEEGNDE
jgi:hypothetical protein